MNKVDDEGEVERAFGTIRRVLFEESQYGRAEGVTLWRYLPGGRWKEVREYEFQSGRTPNEGKEGGEGVFDLKGEGSRRELRSPEALKKAGSKVVGALKSVTGKKAVGREQDGGKAKGGPGQE